MLTLVIAFLRRLFVLGRRALQAAIGRLAQGAAAGPRVAGGNLIFRMRAWPQLPEHGRTADVYRMLSVMSNRPVNREWLLARCRMAPQQLDALLQHLIAEGSVEVIDPARFAAGEAWQA